MMRRDAAALLDRLNELDLALLHDVEKFRLLSTKQLQRLHFDHRHPTPLAAARACNRALVRLRELKILATLDRRVGGVRRGSAGFVWYLGSTGELLLRRQRGQAGRSGRHSYQEPSHVFLQHTLAVADTAIQAIEASRRGDIELLELQTEPANWRQSLSAHGIAKTLKPDLHLVSATGDYEDHWFVEVDRDQEHLPVIVRKCLEYEAYRATGRYQASHGLFPAVLWIAPDQARAEAILGRVAATQGLDPALFRACASRDFLAVLSNRPPP